MIFANLNMYTGNFAATERSVAEAVRHYGSTVQSADNAHARAVELPQRLEHDDFRDRHR
jgi:hypothetical protein